MKGERLTEAQRRALERMARGDEVWTISGRHPHTFWKGAIAQRAPSFATLHALNKAGAIEEFERDFTGVKYRITPAGRAALSPEQDAPASQGEDR
jgi:hypothetical protein